MKSFKQIITVFTSLLLVLITGFSYNVAASNMVSEVSPDSLTAESGYEFITENDTFMLYANKQSGQFYIQDKKTETKWYSNPAVKEGDTTSAVFKMEQSSLLLISSYDETADILSKSNSEAMSVRKNGAIFKKIDNGFEIYYNFSALDIKIPVRITLNENGFNASVPVDGIKENSTLFGLSLLPYFGAGHPDEEGYILLPDGSGSLMYFNNQRQSAADYRVPVYGRDALSSAVTKPQDTYNVNMPVFGIKNSKGIAFAIIENGGAQAMINAVPNNKITPYAICYADFALRGTDTVVLGETTGSPQSYLMYQTDDITIDGINIRYNLVADKTADYNTMAQIYREYLVDKYQLESKKTKNQPICLEFYGAVKKKKSFLGIPFTTTQNLSEMPEISDVLKSLNQENISAVQVILQQWTKQQLAKKADSKLSLIGSIGNKSDIKQLISQIEKSGGAFYPSVAFQEVSKSGSGVSVYSDTIRNISNMPAGKYTFKQNTLIKDNSASKKYFLTVEAQNKLLSKIVSATKKYSINNLFLGELNIYTDYGKKTVSRSETMNNLSNLIKQTAEQKELMIENPPDYAFKGVNFALNVPMNSNGYTATDESIPFYQLVVSGLFAYSGEPINLAGNVNGTLLKSLETGSALHYTFITKDNNIIDGTDLDWLYSADFDKWKENITEYYKITQKLFNATEGGRIMHHTQLERGIACTTYENGVKVYVNYTDSDYDAEGKQIPANGYLIWETKESANE